MTPPTPQSGDKELTFDQAVDIICASIDSPATITIIRKLQEMHHESQAAAVKEAVNKELDRLNGFLEIAQLCEEDLDRMLIWVKNSKWALIAPKGENTQGEQLRQEQGGDK